MILTVPNLIENPYRLPRPSSISVSGGRTSGFMLYHVLQAFGGELPADVHPLFFNTGKEREETLEFLHEIEQRWRVPLVWLEYTRTRDEAGNWHPDFRIVDFHSASRKGEPFELLVRAKSYLPNVVTRFCTAELKVRTAKRYMLSIGVEHWHSAVGIRADEPNRLNNNSDSRERWERIHPMADAGVVVEDVMDFWAHQPFDLQLRQDEGNCDLCFLKGRRKLIRLIQERPDSADWWMGMEKEIGEHAPDRAVARFSQRRTYRDLLIWSLGGPLYAGLGPEGAAPPADDEVDDCNCTD